MAYCGCSKEAAIMPETPRKGHARHPVAAASIHVYALRRRAADSGEIGMYVAPIFRREIMSASIFSSSINSHQAASGVFTGICPAARVAIVASGMLKWHD